METTKAHKMFKISTNRSNITIVNNLKDLISNLLSNILPENQVSMYVTPDNMLLWEKAFTNETFDPTNNLEEDEYKGDRIEKCIFPLYLDTRDPTYTPKDISNIDMLIMEKKTQYDLAFELGFIEFIRLPHHQQPSTGVGGDVFESFFGALDTISDKMMEGMGLINSYNMTAYIFNQNIIPENLRMGNIKMVVEQIFIQLGLKIEPHIKQDQNFTATLNLNEDQLEFFESHNIHLPFVLGTGTAGSLKPALKIAYEEAKLTLETHGVNEAFIEEIKQSRKKERIEKEIEKIEPLKLNINVKDLVIQLLSPIITQNYVLMKFVDDKYMPIWEKIFNTDLVFNQPRYEKLLFFGELLIKSLLAKQLTAMYKEDDYNKEDYNNILSNVVQNYTIFLLNNPLSYLASGRVLEAFVGAIQYISDELLKGTGLINCNRFVKFIFKKKLIPYEYRYTHPKTVVEQMFSPFFGQKHSKPIIEYEYDEDEKLHHYKISLTDEQLAFLQQYGFKIKTKLLSESVGNYKNQTQKEAYAKALLVLEKYHINKNELNKIKNKLDFKHPKLNIYNAVLEQKRITDGYDYLYFAAPTKTKTVREITIQLVGVKGNKKTILSSIIEDASIDKMDAKVNLVKMYLGL